MSDGPAQKPNHSLERAFAGGNKKAKRVRRTSINELQKEKEGGSGRRVTPTDQKSEVGRDK